MPHKGAPLIQTVVGMPHKGAPLGLSKHASQGLAPSRSMPHKGGHKLKTMVALGSPRQDIFHGRIIARFLFCF